MKTQTLILTAYARKELRAFLRAGDKEPEFMTKKKQAMIRCSFRKVLQLLLKDAPAESRAKIEQEALADDIVHIVSFSLGQDDQERKEFQKGMIGQHPSKVRRYLVDKLLDHYLEDLPPTSEIVTNRHQLLDEIMLVFEMILMDERRRQEKKLMERSIMIAKQIHNWPKEEEAAQ